MLRYQFFFQFRYDIDYWYDIYQFRDIDIMYVSEIDAFADLNFNDQVF